MNMEAKKLKHRVLKYTRLGLPIPVRLRRLAGRFLNSRVK
jgi:hypothetical protein